MLMMALVIPEEQYHQQPRMRATAVVMRLCLTSQFGLVSIL